jgi:hypothetical protein
MDDIHEYFSDSGLYSKNTSAVWDRLDYECERHPVENRVLLQDIASEFDVESTLIVTGLPEQMRLPHAARM